MRGTVGQIDANEVALEQNVAALQEPPSPSLTPGSTGTNVGGPVQTQYGTRASRASVTGMTPGAVFFETDTHLEYYFNGSAWLYGAGVQFGLDASKPTVNANDEGALYFAYDTGKRYRVEGGAWTERNDVINATTELRVNGTKVVGARGLAVADVASADAADLASAITLANETKAKLNTILARLRSTTGHGLIT